MKTQNIFQTLFLTLTMSCAFFASIAWSESDKGNLTTQSFNVENMTCGTCPISVKTAMSRVEGVKTVDVNFETKIATVVYDPKRTNAELIAQASSSIGFPASKVNENNER